MPACLNRCVACDDIILEGSSRVRALICVKPLSLSSSHLCDETYYKRPSYRTRRFRDDPRAASMKLTMTELHFPRGGSTFQTSWSITPAAGAALRGPSQPLAPPSGTRAPAFLSVRALKKPTPRHRRTFRTRQPLASSTHDLDTMVTRWSRRRSLYAFSFRPYSELAF